MATPAKGLGRGLSALMGEGAPTINRPAPRPQPAAPEVAKPAETNRDGGVQTLAVTALVAGKYQPRRHFDEEALAELADSIERHGLMQPIVVRQIAPGTYEIIGGERRWRASKLAKLNEVPVIIRELTDTQALELSLIENIQRADLNPLEEAEGYQRLMEEFKYTQENLAQTVGKSRSHIANLLRLLKLPGSIKKRIDSGELTMGHARALLMAKDPEELAQKIVEVGLSVRQAEEMAKGTTLPVDADVSTPILAAPMHDGQGRAHHSGAGRAEPVKNEDVAQLEAMLADSLGLHVSIRTKGAQAGEITIRYESLMQLDEVLRRLGGSV